MAAVIGGVLGLLGSLAAGGLNYSGARAQNKANLGLAREQMGFQERMSNTSYQRAIADMTSAGINPILAYQQGGASTPVGTSIAQQNELAGFASSALDMQRLFNENRKVKSEIEINKAYAELLKADIPGKKAEAQIDQSTYGKVLRYINRIIPFVGGTGKSVSSAAGLIKAIK